MLPLRDIAAVHAAGGCRVPAMPRRTSTMAAACALGVLAGGGELQLEDPRPWSTQGAAEPASALAASLARPLPLRAWEALPTWGSMIT